MNRAQKMLNIVQPRVQPVEQKVSFTFYYLHYL